MGTTAPFVLTGCADAATLARVRAALTAPGVAFVDSVAALRHLLRAPPTGVRLAAVEADYDVRGAAAFLEHHGDARIVFVVRDAVDVLRAEPGTMERWRTRCVEFFAWPEERSLVVRWEKLCADPTGQLARIAAHLELPADGFDAASLVPPAAATATVSLTDWWATQRTDNRDAIRQAGYPDPRRDARLALWSSVRTTFGQLGRR